MNRALLEHERAAWADHFKFVAGLDEAGRGPLAGPVVAAAVLIEKTFLSSPPDGFFRGLTDSKKMSAEARDLFFEKLTHHDAIRIGVGQASVEEIDRLNILRATHVAMHRAVSGAGPRIDLILVDGLPVPGLPCASRSIVKGDGKSLSIAAASVIAKVTRDRLMQALDAQYPAYGFARHKGYGTHEHLKALQVHGPSPVHRRSFEPVRQLVLDL